MYEDGAAVLQMKRVFLKAEKYNRKKYMTRIRSFDKEAEEMTLYTSRGDVNEISLDAVYECIFEVKEGRFGCEGVILKRFRDQEIEQFGHDSLSFCEFVYSWTVTDRIINEL